MLIICAQLESIASRRDRTFKITFGTNELSPEQVAELSAANQDQVFVAIKRDELKQKEVDSLEVLESEYEDKGKTQAQRIRGVLFLLWSQDKEGFETFEPYYKNKTEKYIEHLKNKIL
jgi:hypothetical protein